MNRIESRVDGLPELAVELLKRPAVKDGTGILLLNGQWQGIPNWAMYLLDDALKEIETLTSKTAKHVMANVILPGDGALAHIDATPLDENRQPIHFSRWHLPIQTNQHAWFSYCDASRPAFVIAPFHMDAGFWHGPVEYWKHHSVFNGGSEARIHVVVDLV